jgi:integrase
MSLSNQSNGLQKKAAPSKGNRIYYDDAIKGFGLRVTAGGARAFVLNYRTRSGRERRYTIGPLGEWSLQAARKEAAALKRRIDRGDDPLAEIRADRDAPSMADLCARFRTDHLSKRRPSTAALYEGIIEKIILPKFRHFKVAEITYSDVDGLHRKVTARGAPYMANRTLAVLSKMFSLAMRWGWRADNPARGIERNPEQKRHRYLTPDELKRLAGALTKAADKQGADIVRLLLLTGARSGEVRSMRWEHLDLAEGVWTKPASTTKQAAMHRAPISAPARQLLSRIYKKSGSPSEGFVFEGRVDGFRADIKKTWAALCKHAKIKDARIHDLRHTYASVLASAGLSLPIIGGLLGHSQPATTARYAHLFDDPLREATERAAKLVTGRQRSAEIVKLAQRR